MPVVIISTVSSSRGEEIAARTAEILGCRSLGRTEVIGEAARVSGAPPERLARALDEPPGWFGMRARERRTHLATIQSVVADVLASGDCVCHGVAAHLYVKGISHVVKVRIVAPVATRAVALAQRRGIGEATARRRIATADARRRRWAASVFKIDESDPERFDLVVDEAARDVAETAAAISELAQQRRFQPMSYSIKEIQDFALASRVRARLVSLDPDVAVTADEGTVHVESKAAGREGDRAASLRELALSVEGVRDAEVTLIDDVFAKAALSMR